MSTVIVIIKNDNFEEVWEFSEEVSLEQIQETLRHIGGRPKDRR